MVKPAKEFHPLNKLFLHLHDVIDTIDNDNNNEDWELRGPLMDWGMGIQHPKKNF